MDFICSKVTEYRLKEKLLSLATDSFSVVRESDGEKVFRVEGGTAGSLGAGGAKTMYDVTGRKLYKMCEALVSLHNRMYVRDGVNESAIVTMKKKKALAGAVSAVETVHVWKGESDKGDPWLELKGDLMRKDFTFKNVHTGSEVAYVTRKLINLNTILAESDTYVVRVNPGYNVALMVFIAVVIDEQYHDGWTKFIITTVVSRHAQVGNIQLEQYM